MNPTQFNPVAVSEFPNGMQDEIQNIHSLYESIWQKIAMELHDGACHHLLHVKLAVGKVQSMLQSEHEAEPVLHELLLAAETALEEIRLISHNLTPAFVVEHGLIEAIKGLIHNTCFDNSPQCSLQVIGNVQFINRQAELHIYRIIQELYSNILRHSHATSCSIAIACSSEKILVEVEDNGVGFNQLHGQEKSGLGLKNVKERARCLHGEVSTYSSPDLGTKTIITFPNSRE